MKIFFLFFFIFSRAAFAEGQITDDKRYRRIIEGRQRILAEDRACTHHPDAVRKNAENQIRQINADRNLRLPKYCMDMNQRRQYRTIVRGEAFGNATRAGWERIKARHPLPPISDRINCSKRDAMKVRTPTSLLGGARG